MKTYGNSLCKYCIHYLNLEKCEYCIRGEGYDKDYFESDYNVWSATASYFENDIVIFDMKEYICRKSNFFRQPDLYIYDEIIADGCWEEL